jgi:hypothetical protein
MAQTRGKWFDELFDSLIFNIQQVKLEQLLTVLTQQYAVTSNHNQAFDRNIGASPICW